MLFLTSPVEPICNAPLFPRALLSAPLEGLLSLDTEVRLLICFRFWSVKIVRLLRPLRCFLRRTEGELAVEIGVASLHVGERVTLEESGELAVRELGAGG